MCKHFGVRMLSEVKDPGHDRSWSISMIPSLRTLQDAVDMKQHPTDVDGHVVKSRCLDSVVCRWARSARNNNDTPAAKSGVLRDSSLLNNAVIFAFVASFRYFFDSTMRLRISPLWGSWLRQPGPSTVRPGIHQKLPCHQRFFSYQSPLRQQQPAAATLNTAAPNRNATVM